MSASRWDAAVVLAVAAAIGLSLLNKAFHIDDPIALRIAANHLVDPLDPLARQPLRAGRLDGPAGGVLAS